MRATSREGQKGPLNNQWQVRKEAIDTELIEYINKQRPRREENTSRQTKTIIRTKHGIKGNRTENKQKKANSKRNRENKPNQIKKGTFRKDRRKPTRIECNTKLKQ